MSGHQMHPTVESLKVSLVKAWTKITQKKFRAPVDSFRGRIERVIAAKGWHIEKYIVLLFCEALKQNMKHVTFVFLH